MIGDAALDRMIATVRALPSLPERAAPEVAAALQAEIEETIVAGTTPDGVAWKPTQRGKQPLRNAAAHIHAAAIGRIVYVRLIGVEAMHHRGTSRGRVRRQVLPEGPRLPPSMRDAVKAVLVRHFRELIDSGGAP